MFYSDYFTILKMKLTNQRIFEYQVLLALLTLYSHNLTYHK